MSELFEKIPLKQLRPGMYINDVYTERGVFLFTLRGKISGYHQIEALRNQGVGFCSIVKEKDINEKNYVTSLVDKWINSESHKKFLTANLKRKEIIGTVKEYISFVKDGKSIPLKELSATVETLIEEVMDNTDYYLGLCQIKSYCDELYIHSVNTAVLVSAFGSYLNYSKEKILEMSIGAIFHDIGKIEYPESLCKKGCYTSSEMEQIKRHPLLGVEILKQRCKKVSPVSLAIVEQHHERTNGCGYPLGLKENQIDETAILCAICDVYDNLVSDKENRSACIPQEALALIYQLAGDQFPRKSVEMFTKLLGIYPVGSFVRLESGEMGIVTKTNRTALLFPQIFILFDPVGERLKVPFVRDVSKTNEYILNHRINCSLDPRLFKIDPIDILVQSLSV